MTGTRLGSASASAYRQDCTSFLSGTVTPPTSTATVMVTPDTCDDDDQAPLTLLKKMKRTTEAGVTVFPTAVPTYAAACSGAVRYSSACSCWGVTAAYTTAPTPVVTVTVTGY